MTICAAIQCINGIVLAADREINRGTDTKYHETKLFTVHRAPDWSISFGYSGHPSFARTVYQKLILFSYSQQQVSDIDALKDAVAYCVSETFASFKQRYVEMAFALQCGDKVSLLRTENKSVTGEIDRRAFLGVGDSSVVRHLERIFCRPPLVICQAVPIAVYIVRQAKAFVPHCGGETDVCVVRPSKVPDWPSQSRIKAIEKCWGAFEYETGVVSYMMNSDVVTDDGFEGVLANFCAEMRKIRNGQPTEHVFPFESY